jgi:hypothetical protein
MTIAALLVTALTAATVLLGWAYFRRYRVTRPPLGVVSLGDVAAMIAGVVLIPYLYLALPSWLVGALLTASTFSVLIFLLEPVLRRRLAIWPIVAALVALDVGLALRSGTTTRAFLAVNDLVLILIVVGVTNLWAQSGLRARDLAVLAGALTLYDAVATGWLPLTSDLITRLAALPFMPMLAWPAVDDQWVGIGLGDLLLATVGPLVLLKAYGRPAGIVAMLLAFATIASLMVLGATSVLRGGFPTMVVLGPLLMAQYGYWTRRSGAERSTARYLAAEPQPEGPVPVSSWPETPPAAGGSMTKRDAWHDGVSWRTTPRPG